MPGNNSFFAGGVHLAVREALSGVDVGAAALNVLSGNLWRGGLLCGGTHCTGNNEHDQKKRIAHGDLLILKSYNERDACAGIYERDNQLYSLDHLGVIIFSEDHRSLTITS